MTDDLELRASDADRNEIVGALREEYAAGRLSHDTFLFRMHAAMDARHVADRVPLRLVADTLVEHAITGPVSAVGRPLREGAG